MDAQWDNNFAGTHLMNLDAFLTSIATPTHIAVLLEDLINGVLEPQSKIVYFCRACGHRFRVRASVATAVDKRFGCPKCVKENP